MIVNMSIYQALVTYDSIIIKKYILILLLSTLCSPLLARISFVMQTDKLYEPFSMGMKSYPVRTNSYSEGINYDLGMNSYQSEKPYTVFFLKFQIVD